MSDLSRLRITDEIVTIIFLTVFRDGFGEPNEQPVSKVTFCTDAVPSRKALVQELLSKPSMVRFFEDVDLALAWVDDTGNVFLIENNRELTAALNEQLDIGNPVKIYIDSSFNHQELRENVKNAMRDKSDNSSHDGHSRPASVSQPALSKSWKIRVGSSTPSVTDTTAESEDAASAWENRASSDWDDFPEKSARTPPNPRHSPSSHCEKCTCGW